MSTTPPDPTRLDGSSADLDRTAPDPPPMRTEEVSSEALDAGRLAPGARREQHPVIGAAALDAMAAFAGPPGSPDHRHAWSAAVEIVAGAMFGPRHGG